MDDDKEENPTIEKKSKETAATKPTFAEIVKSEYSNYRAPIKKLSTTTINTLKENAAAATVAAPPPTNTPTESIDIDIGIEFDMEKRQYFLAEVESAPKHANLIRVAEEENLTKIMQAYSEQCHCQKNEQQTNQQSKEKSLSSTLTDEPSCSRMLQETNLPKELQNKSLTTTTTTTSTMMMMKQSKMPTNVLQKNAIKGKEFIALMTDNFENQQKREISGLTAANGNAAATAGGTEATTVAATTATSTSQKPFTTVIAGTAVVIPTALTASKPAESPTPPIETSEIEPMNASSVPSIGSLVCRICHNSENPERLVSPCLCKGSLSYVHIHCLERWISTSRSTVCELCQFQYKTEQTLRYTCIQSLRMWYSRSMSRRALQEDCQMFSLLTLVAFGIIGTLLVGIQYYFIQGRHWGLSSMWTKGWLLFFLFTTLIVYFINIYMIIRSQLAPWYRWWQSARDIKLILENRKPFKILHDWRTSKATRQRAMSEQQQQQQQPQSSPMAPSSLPPPPPPPPIPLQPAAATAQNSNIPQIPTTPTIPVLPSSVCATATSTATATATTLYHNKISREHEANAIAAINKSHHNDAASVVICGVGAPPSQPPPTSPSLLKLFPNTMAAGGNVAMQQPYKNKLQISVELTESATTTASTAAQIIEIPLENIDSCAAAAAAAFEYVKSKRVTATTMATMTTATANV